MAAAKRRTKDIRGEDHGLLTPHDIDELKVEVRGLKNELGASRAAAQKLHQDQLAVVPELFSLLREHIALQQESIAIQKESLELQREGIILQRRIAANTDGLPAQIEILMTRTANGSMGHVAEKENG